MNVDAVPGLNLANDSCGFPCQSPCEPGHGQGGLRVADHGRQQHPRHRRPDQHHPGGAGAPGVPAHGQDRYRACVRIHVGGGVQWGSVGCGEGAVGVHNSIDSCLGFLRLLLKTDTQLMLVF